MRYGWKPSTRREFLPKALPADYSIASAKQLVRKVITAIFGGAVRLSGSSVTSRPSTVVALKHESMWHPDKLTTSETVTGFLRVWPSVNLWGGRSQPWGGRCDSSNAWCFPWNHHCTKTKHEILTTKKKNLHPCLAIRCQDASKRNHWCCWRSPRSKSRRDQKAQLTGKWLPNANQRDERAALEFAWKLSVRQIKRNHRN